MMRAMFLCSMFMFLFPVSSPCCLWLWVLVVVVVVVGDDAVIIVSIESHRDMLEASLLQHGIDPHTYQQRQQLFLLDAHQTLAVKTTT